MAQPADAASDSSSSPSSTTPQTSPAPSRSSLDQASATSADEPPQQSAEDASLSSDDKKKKALALKDEGNKAFLAGHFDEAKIKYGEAIALDATVPALWSNRAACELKLEQHGLAIEDAGKAIELDANFSKAYYRRASAYLSILDPKSALPDLKVIVRLEPKNATVRAQHDATVKLLRRLQFEKAIRKPEGEKSWQSAVQHLLEGTGGTTVPASYDGPRLEDGDTAEPQAAAPAKGDEEDSASLLTAPNTSGPHMGKISQKFVDDMIEFFKKGGRLPVRYAWQILLGAQKAFLSEESLVEYNVPESQTVDVVGDTHGQFYDFVHLLSLTGPPSPTHAVLFNGDFVDRGSWSVEIALTILAYKWLYPKTTLVNRGNHETSDMNKVYGFEGEVKAKLGPGDFTFKLFTELFIALPLATIIETPREPLQGQDLPATVSKAQKSPVLRKDNGRKRFFVVHGGLFSRDGVTLDEIRAIDRHRIGQPGQAGLMMELLWSDPQNAHGRGPSKRGVGLGFGPDITRQWCELNGVTAVLRSHEVRQGGYAEEHDGMCCTVFSAPNYCDSVGNKGAFARIDDQGTIHWTTFEAQPHPDIKPMAYQGGPMGGMVS